MERPAIVLLSGGLDSTTVLAIAKDQGFTPYALSFRYGQRHSVELEAAARVAEALGAAGHVVADVPIGIFGGSALTADIAVPKHDSVDEVDADSIPVTYVPARNLIFLSFAVAYAETAGATDIFTGVTAVDYSGYPDCRPEFMDSFEETANRGTRMGVEGESRIRLHSPLITLSKADIILEGLRLGVDYSITSSCYDPDEQGRACGRCDTCLLRLKGFSEAGVADPVTYRSASA
ncbi:7-cyano-7-deazaguanine synthase QueC [Saccharothrix sp. ALI-22-I]|uniref:7-cyano-7-deazaguanine synthase QueC n=1 Tax=Saccharothrix sp. ALI-22-I TaxID=1933778 RepID=UPI00097C95A9|nr:7-cyano-7-deazaguanine synthase QueC [Saccharothrix sp. ALI-22-I]ONI83974.1 7-cyano-7-deazaguanine synthase QueC [Saccharothrix sp. ALI-22-I]